MDGLSDKIKELESKIESKELAIAQSNKQPEMTRAQADAILNVAKNTEDFFGVKVSQKVNELIEHDDAVKEKFTDLAKDTVSNQIDTYDTKNKLQNKKNYYELNEKDVISLGGDKSSTKGQQFSIVMIKRFFWILFMATLGTFFVAPLSVIVELFQGISFKNIERVEYESKDGKKTEWVIKRHKLGKIGTTFGWFIGVCFWVLEVYLIMHFPRVFLILAAGVFVMIAITNIIFGINKSFINRLFRKANKDTNTEEVEDSDVVEIETESEDI